MNSNFEIFDTVSGNVVDVYERECDAIEALVDIARERGTAEVARFALFRERDGESTLVAMKDALVLRVEAERSLAIRPEARVRSP
jgi:hypothetical protein